MHSTDLIPLSEQLLFSMHLEWNLLLATFTVSIDLLKPISTQITAEATLLLNQCFGLTLIYITLNFSMFTQLKHYESITPTLAVPTGKPSSHNTEICGNFPYTNGFVWPCYCRQWILHMLDRTDRLYQ